MNWTQTNVMKISCVAELQTNTHTHTHLHTHNIHTLHIHLYTHARIPLLARNFNSINGFRNYGDAIKMRKSFVNFVWEIYTVNLKTFPIARNFNRLARIFSFFYSGQIGFQQIHRWNIYNYSHTLFFHRFVRGYAISSDYNSKFELILSPL